MDWPVVYCDGLHAELAINTSTHSACQNKCFVPWKRCITQQTLHLNG